MVVNCKTRCGNQVGIFGHVPEVLRPASTRIHFARHESAPFSRNPPATEKTDTTARHVLQRSYGDCRQTSAEFQSRSRSCAFLAFCSPDIGLPRRRPPRAGRAAGRRCRGAGTGPRRVAGAEGRTYGEESWREPARGGRRGPERALGRGCGPRTRPEQPRPRQPPRDDRQRHTGDRRPTPAPLVHAAGDGVRCADRRRRRRLAAAPTRHLRPTRHPEPARAPLLLSGAGPPRHARPLARGYPRAARVAAGAGRDGVRQRRRAHDLPADRRRGSPLARGARPAVQSAGTQVLLPRWVCSPSR